MSYYSSVGRDLDIRDSVDLRSEVRRRGLGTNRPASTLVVVGVDTTPFETAPFPGLKKEGIAVTGVKPLCDESGRDESSGTYTVPDVSVTHNHAQNAETEFRNFPRKMAVSRINEGNDVLNQTLSTNVQVSVASSSSTGSPRRLGKVAENHSRINDGHDIFGNPVSNFKSAPPGAPEYLQERPNRSAVKSPWVGFTDIQDKSYRQKR